MKPNRTLRRFLSHGGQVIFFLVCSAASATPTDAQGTKLKIIAHRGASYLAPEESRPAFLAARALGADYLEFDLHMTRDGHIIANHDRTFERTSDIKKVFARIP